MGDGPERGNTRIERLFRKEAMIGAKAVEGNYYYREAWLLSVQSPCEMYLDV